MEEMSIWSVKTPRAPSRHCGDATVLVIRLRPCMNEHPPPPSCARALACVLLQPGAVWGLTGRAASTSIFPSTTPVSFSEKGGRRTRGLIRGGRTGVDCARCTIYSCICAGGYVETAVGVFPPVALHAPQSGAPYSRDNALLPAVHAY